MPDTDRPTEDKRVIDAAHWIDTQLSVWFGGDAKSALRALAHAVGMVSKDAVDEPDREAWLQKITPLSWKLVVACEGEWKGTAIGALGGAILFLTEERPSATRPDEKKGQRRAERRVQRISGT